MYLFIVLVYLVNVWTCTNEVSNRMSPFMNVADKNNVTEVFPFVHISNAESTTTKLLEVLTCQSIFINDHVYFTNFVVPNSETDSTYIFIFREASPPLFLYKNVSPNVLNRLGFFITRAGCLIIYICIAWVKCIPYIKPRYILSASRKQKRNEVKKRLRIIRLFLSRPRRLLKLQLLVAPCFLFLLLCGDVHPNPGPVIHRVPRHASAEPLNVASWNVRTLLDTKRAAARPTAIVSRELARYNIDIAAISETRVLGDTTLEEVTGGYTFFLKGKPEGSKCHHGVGFAIRSTLVKQLDGKHPTGINERLMTMSLPLVNSTLSIISAYAPTLAQSDEVKEIFYSTLSDAIEDIPSSHKLLVMGDFNARVGTDHLNWEDVIGRHGVGRENSNGTLLLSLCSRKNLIITNTLFQQKNRHKTTWMHPGTKQWHMIDYVITRQRDVRDVLHTRAMCGSCTWSDHRLVKCKLSLIIRSSRHRSRLKPAKKLNLDRLQSVECRAALQAKLSEAYNTNNSIHPNAEASWECFKNLTSKVAEEVLGFPERKHRDWFDENDPLIRPLLNELHGKHIAAIEDRCNNDKAQAYRTCKQQVQKSLRNMKDCWWKAKAVELQESADKRDFKTFYQGLKAVYGPKYKSSPAIKSKEGVLLTEPSQRLNRWAEHFEGVLNQQSDFDMSVLQEIPQWDVNYNLADVPTLDEVMASIKDLTSGKAAGADGIPPDIFKHGGTAIAEELLKIFSQIWGEQKVPQDFRDAEIVHLYKNKGDCKCCDNHRGISLLCIAGKILARLLLNRLNKHIYLLGLIPESQCGFRPGRGTTDMLFALRQLQEKCKLHSVDLYLLFIDLTKAFDTVNRDGLWAMLAKIGCPELFIDLIRSFHDDMTVKVRDGGERSKPFKVTSGTKQGCVLAPTLFSIFFSLMLQYAFKNTTDGVVMKSRLDRNLGSINTSHFNAPTKVNYFTIRDLLFADDCALAALSQEALQRLCDCFANAARKFGLTISIKKTETLYQPGKGSAHVPQPILIDGQQLNDVPSFKYLGGIASSTASMDLEIDARIAKATSAFGRLTKRLWTNKGVRLDTKVSVYKAAVLTSLLYGCETWTLNQKQILRLEKFNQSCLRRIARIRWFHKVTNYEVLDRCKIPSIQSMVDKAKLRWTGHVIRMEDDRIPKMMLYGRLGTGSSSRGNHNTYLNSVKATLRACEINSTHLEEQACDRNNWRATLNAGIAVAETARTRNLIDKRLRRKARTDLALLPT